MTGLTQLWLPIVLSAVAVFLLSSLVHMVLPWHKGDYRAVPDEGRVMDALRPFAIPPGDYMIPRPSGPQEMKSSQYMEKLQRGPVLIATVLPNGQWSMGKGMTQWFVYLLVVGLFAGYIASRALAPGAPYLEVFRFVGAAAFLAYAGAEWPRSIWYHRAWNITVRNSIDGLLYGLVTAGFFGWLWPR